MTLTRKGLCPWGNLSGLPEIPAVPYCQSGLDSCRFDFRLRCQASRCIRDCPCCCLLALLTTASCMDTDDATLPDLLERLEVQDGAGRLQQLGILQVTRASLQLILFHSHIFLLLRFPACVIAVISTTKFLHTAITELTSRQLLTQCVGATPMVVIFLTSCSGLCGNPWAT